MPFKSVIKMKVPGETSDWSVDKAIKFCKEGGICKPVPKKTEFIAGILPYRIVENQLTEFQVRTKASNGSDQDVSKEHLEFFLGKAGGPWFQNKPNSWTVMKGHLQEEETCLERVAEREFFEECGWHVDLDKHPEKKLIEHGRFAIFMVQIPEIEPRFCHSNMFELNGSEFPEIEAWNWIDSADVLPMIFKSQRELFEKAINHLNF